MAEFFLLSNKNTTPQGLLTSNTESELTMLSSSVETATSLLTATFEYTGDAFSGKDMFGTCDVYNMSSEILAYDSAETVGSVAYDCGTETVGSVAYASTETVGSVACDCGGGFSGGFGGDCGFVC